MRIYAFYLTNQSKPIYFKTKKLAETYMDNLQATSTHLIGYVKSVYVREA